MKQCNTCKEQKQLNAFHKCTSSPDGYAYTCKQCSAEFSKKYTTETTRGRISSLVRVAKQRSKKLQQPCDISIDYIEGLWKLQDGRCAYTGLKMNIRGDWQVSIERIDPSRGYTRDNTCLICLELNVQYQWNNEKITHFRSLPRWKGVNVAYQDLTYLRKKMYSARKRAKEWDGKKRFMDDRKCDLSLQSLFSILVKQEGLCAYSGIIMTHVSNDDRSVSIERIDPRKGYYHDNIVLVCQIFNVGDHRVENTDMHETYPTWNQEKCGIFLKNNCSYIRNGRL